jgi:hypothetical protein
MNTSEKVAPAEKYVRALTLDRAAVYPVRKLEGDFGRQQILASPLPGQQLPVLSA